MARPKKTAAVKEKESRRGNVFVEWNPGTPNEKQRQFFASKTRFTAYGGAKGGGKTWAVRVKAVLGALYYPGIRILIMRRTYRELEENHINPMLRLLPQAFGRYNGTNRRYTFFNGSTINFGHWQGELSEQEYQGQEYDWIFIDEATQFSERAFRYLGGCLRGVNEFPKRMYLTCNPGGVGHNWVKRLFIDRDFRTGSENPEEDEDPRDYSFIFATVEDNTALMGTPEGKSYLQMLASMPENVRAAYRYGDWSSLGGNYFPEFRTDTHVCERFEIPVHWKKYRTIDYGLDRLACYWVAVDEDGRSWVYREYCESGLIVQDAAKRILERTLPNEKIEITFAPPDLWSRQKDTGKTMAELFMTNGLSIVKAGNNRVQGHMMIKDFLAPRKDGKPGLMVFKSCRELINDISSIQADEDNPDDCAKEPHEITHTVDSLRYYCISRTLPAERPEPEAAGYEDEGEEGYEDFMTGGELSSGYLAFG